MTMRDIKTDPAESLRKAAEKIESGEWEIVEYSQAPLAHVQNVDAEYYLVVEEND